jgi:NAD(P)H-hydrate epimerase
MGDVLSGVVGGLLAQGLSLAQASECGVLLHSTAADIAARKGERGLLASDVVNELRALVNPC